MKLKKAKEDILVFSFLIAVSLWLLLYVVPNEIPVPQGVLQGGSFTPSTLPLMVIWALMACCVCGLVTSVIRYVSLRRAGEEEGAVRRWRDLSGQEKRAELTPLLAFLLCLLYYLLFTRAGFIPATVIVPPLVLLVLGDLKWRHYLYVYGFCAVMYLVFTMILRVHLH